MTRQHILIIAILLLSLACGTMPTAVTVATVPQNTPEATQTAPAANVQIPYTTSTRTPVLLPVAGCWNIRSEPSTNGAVVDVQCSGKVEVIQWSENGFIQIVGGYICGQSVGMSAKCQ